jgi:hypothetical protein
MWWKEITCGQGGLHIRAASTRSVRYLSKYASKTFGLPLLELQKLVLLHQVGAHVLGRVLLVYAPYLHATLEIKRIWGVFNRPHFVYVSRTVVFVDNMPKADLALKTIIRYLRRVSRRPRAPADRKFSCFVRDSNFWFKIFCRTLQAFP